MATFVAIPEKTQTATAMKRVLDYVMRDKKTMFYDREKDRSYKLVSSQNCVPETAFNEFMATKHRFNKAKGVFFKQYVQSFKPDCGATPQQIHQIGLETAKAFEGFEVVVATHIDRDHWHNHFVVNSVNSETGLKIQINEKGLEELRNRSDEICQQFGLEVLKPYQKPKQRSMNQREYRTAIRGDSKKLRLMNAIDMVVVHSQSKEKFIENMKRLGYDVKWIDRYKYITYTTPDGQRFRDNRLFDDKYLKENMEDLYGLKYAETEESVTADKRRNEECTDRTVQTDFDNPQRGAVQCVGESCDDGWRANCEKHGFSFQVANAGNCDEYDLSFDKTTIREDEQRYSMRSAINRSQIGESSQGADEEFGAEIADGTDEFGGANQGEGFITDEAAFEMDADWSDIANGVLNLAADIEMIFNTNDRKDERKKYINERKNTRKNSKKQSQDGGFNMSM